MSNVDESWFSLFLAGFSSSLIVILLFYLLFNSVFFVSVSILIMLVFCVFLGLIFSVAFSFSSLSSVHIIKSWRVVIVTVDGAVYYLGQGLSWADAKKLRDDAVKLFEDPKEFMVSVRCINLNGGYGVRNFVKANIVHIGWLED